MGLNINVPAPSRHSATTTGTAAVSFTVARTNGQPCWMVMRHVLLHPVGGPLGAVSLPVCSRPPWTTIPQPGAPPRPCVPARITSG